MALNGIDISGWQSGLDLSAVPCDFAIVKATEGTTYTNPCCVGHVEQAIALGKKWGTYHYITGKGAVAEADFYIDSISNWVGKGIMCLDWESGGNSAWGDESYLEQMARRVIERTGIAPVIYVQASRYSQVKAVADRLNCGMWVAQYPNYARTGYQATPWNEGAYTCAIRQYSSTGALSGWSGNLDLNKFYGDAAAWDAYATGGSVSNDDQVSKEEAERIEAERVAGLPDSLKGYKDLWPDTWYIPYVQYVVEHGIMSGYGDNIFGVDDALTRVQGVTVLFNANGQESYSLPFYDVEKEPWYNDAAEWATKNGIIQGDGAGNLRPNDPATRAEFVTMLYRCAGSPDAPSEPQGFSDWASVPDYAKAAVSWAVGAGIIEGNGGTIDPNGVCTRAMAAAMIERYLG